VHVRVCMYLMCSCGTWCGWDMVMGERLGVRVCVWGSEPATRPVAGVHVCVRLWLVCVCGHRPGVCASVPVAWSVVGAWRWLVCAVPVARWWWTVMVWGYGGLSRSMRRPGRPGPGRLTLRPARPRHRVTG
jgi:hypothetical protein